MRKGSEVSKVMVFHPGVNRLVTPEEAETIRTLYQSPKQIEKEVAAVFEERENKLAEASL